MIQKFCQAFSQPCMDDTEKLKPHKCIFLVTIQKESSMDSREMINSFPNFVIAMNIVGTINVNP